MSKIEIIEYENGTYAVRRTSGILFKTVEFADVTYTNAIFWRTPRSTYFKDCFTTDLRAALRTYTLTGKAEGIVRGQGNDISLNDMVRMVELAKTNPGMKDLLEKAKSFLILSEK